MTHLTPNIASPFSKGRNDLEKKIFRIFKAKKEINAFLRIEAAKGAHLLLLRASSQEPCETERKQIFPESQSNGAIYIPSPDIEEEIVPSSTTHKRDKEQIKLKEASLLLFARLSSGL